MLDILNIFDILYVSMESVKNLYRFGKSRQMVELY